MTKTTSQSLKSSPAEKVQALLRLRELIERSKEIEERQSDQRIRFFLTLCTATAAVIGFFLKGDPLLQNEFHLKIYAATAFFILFVYGILTFAQVIWNRRNIEKYNAYIHKLTSTAMRLDSDIKQALQLKDDEADKQKALLARTIKGTLAQFLYVTEALLGLATSLLLADAFNWRPGTTGWIVFLTFVFIVIGLVLWSEYVRRGIAKSTDVASA